MFNAFLAVVMPVLLVFGLYHLLTWFDIFRINSRVYWKRVALAAAISHLLLATGFFLFTYFDFQSNRGFVALGMNYSTFVFRHSEFWRLIAIFDTVPMLGVLAVFSMIPGSEASGSSLMALTLAIVYVVGTLQWYYVGGGIGAAVNRIWEGLKTGDDEEEGWFQ
jgi:hypothetical protein